MLDALPHNVLAHIFAGRSNGRNGKATPISSETLLDEDIGADEAVHPCRNRMAYRRVQDESPLISENDPAKANRTEITQGLVCVISIHTVIKNRVVKNIGSAASYNTRN
jgi:hypothetical protein